MFMRRACVFWCFSILLVLVSVAKANVASTNEYRSDYSYNEPAGGWLKLHHMPATFMDAFLHCKLEGAVLASPLNANLQKAMGIMQETSNIRRPIFTGIHATISKSDLTSIEGIPLSKIPVTWAPGGIDIFEAECTIMLWNGTIALARCTDKYRYVCYKEKTTNPVIITECGTVDTGYKRDLNTGSCYKFHRHAMTWRRAQITCLAEGGHLAIINSIYEANMLKDLFAKNPEGTILTKEQIGILKPNGASLGYLDWNKNGAWYTVDGQTLEEAGYSKWDSRSNDNLTDHDGTKKYCACMLRNGELYDTWCDSYTYPFICEKTFNSLLKN